MSSIIDSITSYFPEKFFSHASTKALGVGSVCYLGLKLCQNNSGNRWGEYLGKATVVTSAIAGLYFSGLLTENKKGIVDPIRYYIPFPFLGGFGGVSISPNIIGELFNNVVGLFKGE